MRGDPAAHDVVIMRIRPTYDRTHPVPPNGRPSFWSTRSIWVVNNLESLRGPSTGTVEPVLHIQWSTRRPVRLDDPRQVCEWYASVLRESTGDEDLETLLNRELLIRMWPELILPGRVREIWESRFPELRR